MAITKKGNKALEIKYLLAERFNFKEELIKVIFVSWR